MKLFLVHCGFYDADLADGIYESHVNYFVCAPTFEEARLKAKALPEFKGKRMHVDGIQEIIAVDGFRVALSEDKALNGSSIVTNIKHRDLAPSVASSVA